ncbi:hypothetical protein NM688_g6115 [Phlebia brevispora]|uniref:Uncharacterized protein n=1 Tax=Phlebia brevispora TaxID=194682 RepID=A0ACC1SK24_9APHY|nr:hypothetical protein NM688_g6115 [Phlebia brevispora]
MGAESAGIVPFMEIGVYSGKYTSGRGFKGYSIISALLASSRPRPRHAKAQSQARAPGLSYDHPRFATTFGYLLSFYLAGFVVIGLHLFLSALLSTSFLVRPLSSISRPIISLSRLSPPRTSPASNSYSAPAPDMDSWRVAVLGDGGVGKTALAVQFTLNCFVEDAYRKQLVVDNKMCFVEVIDTAGQEEYATLRDQWVREGQGFILVYSIASRATFDRLEVFRQAMLKVKRQKPVFMLVGNKCDKTTEREVSREEGIQMARNFGCEFMETSAKTAMNVERLFTTLVRLLRQSKQAEQGTPGQARPVEKEKKKGKCIIL